MSLLTSADNIQLAQEVVVTTLRSVFRTRGSEVAFAKRAAISPIHLSYILHQKRMPRLDTARRISQWLPLSGQDRRIWLTYVEEYWYERRTLTREIQQITLDDAEMAFLEVIRAHRQAMYGTDPTRVHQSCELALMMGEELMRVFPTQSNPTTYLALCGSVYEMHALLGHQVEALAMAKHSKLVATIAEPHNIRNIDAFEVQRWNSARLVVVSLNQLGLAKEASDLCQQLATDKALQASAAYLKPTLYWDWLNTMALQTRSSIREARWLAREAWAAIERTHSPDTGPDWAPLIHLLVSRSYGEVCISHGNYREAEETLRPEYEALESMPHLGLARRVMFLRTYARLLWRQPKRDIDQWRHVIQQAIHSAEQAGLSQELTEIQQEYGELVADSKTFATT